MYVDKKELWVFENDQDIWHIVEDFQDFQFYKHSTSLSTVDSRFFSLLTLWTAIFLVTEMDDSSMIFIGYNV